MATKATLQAVRFTGLVSSNPRRYPMVSSKPAARISGSNKRNPSKGLNCTGIEAGKLALPLVATVTVNGEVAPLAKDTVEGT